MKDVRVQPNSGWSYLGGKRWADITRDERFFCQHLYGLIQQEGVHKFAEKLREDAGLQDLLPSDADWEIGFEVCFYRDHRHHFGLNLHQYSQKRTFDLCLFSHKHIVIIEAKSQQGFKPKQMGDFILDRINVSEAICRSDPSSKDVKIVVVALASSRYVNPFLENPEKWEKFNFDVTANCRIFDGKPITWDQLSAHFDNDPVLRRADSIFGDKHPTGEELMQRRVHSSPTWIGRIGGLEGQALRNDLKDNLWKSYRYETSNSVASPGPNWFLFSDFVDKVLNSGEANDQKPE